jgi:hypothetical protein
MVELFLKIKISAQYEQVSGILANALRWTRKVKVTHKLICKSPSNPDDLRSIESSQSSQWSRAKLKVILQLRITSKTSKIVRMIHLPASEELSQPLRALLVLKK